jgi:hypothetical protein
MLYLILIIVVVIGSVLLLNLRVRVELDDNRRLVFFGLGRSGLEFDLAGKISYLKIIVKSLAVEELQGEIEGGFDSPDLTGRAFGYYRAVLGAVPALAGHFRYYPVWTGAVFSGSLRLAVVLPLYKMLYRTLLLVFRLPLRKIIKVAIGTKKGEQDVK